ncbi:MAG: excinuclease ABC subunit UvrB [Planctomycetota bacterium]|jgi:excinuclease ABC subunit B|nr:excinuclease ABC subunit UvrB [Planctomycetota bacterium]
MTDALAPAGFKLEAPYEPMGDQPDAIVTLVNALEQRDTVSAATLLGVTGSGKTFTMANVIQQLQRPALILSHNKTLAAQLYAEFKGFFPDNAVEYFVSYYDYYQPEAYVPSKDLYIEKESSINEEIDKLRLSATRSLLSRRDVIIVASVSSIYGLGSPKNYQDLTVTVEVGVEVERDAVLAKLVAIQYDRGDINFERGRFRVRGDVVEIWPAYEDKVVRIEFFGDEVEAISTVHALTGEIVARHDIVSIFPAKHFVVDEPTLEQAVVEIEKDLNLRHSELLQQGALVEAQRLLSRTKYDIEMLSEVGYCSGIENYSRYLSGRGAGERPYCLYDFFPDDFLTIVDESHVTVPQLGGMYAGDRSRKMNLVDHGFRLPSALDNRPMRFDEWEAVKGQTVFVSATPSSYEAEHEQARAEQLIRPTGIIDPEIHVRPTEGQVDDLIKEVSDRCSRGERSLITTLTKRLAEDLSEFLNEAGVKTTWLHSEIDALERIEILQQLRDGRAECLVGVNLLREGLDLPEVSLVAIFDADKQGFLRSETSLIQTIGRAARHVDGTVILYADRESAAMSAALGETERRRAKQARYNQEHNITPRAAMRSDMGAAFREQLDARKVAEGGEPGETYEADDLEMLKARMLSAAENLDFEEAARLRDRIRTLESGNAATTSGPGRPKRARARRRRR